MKEPEVRVISWAKASEAEQRTGMLGYLRVAYGSLELDGIVLRKTAEGRFALSFPARTDRAGKKHSYIRPRDSEAREAIERQILWQLGEHPEFAR